jgi:ribosomal-protein-serine acetyltransferase
MGTLVGVIGHNRIDWANRIGFPAYWIVPGSQGQGIMTACCRAVIDHAFRELKVSRVIVAVATNNLRAQKIPERLGFTKISTLKKAEWLYDHYVDHYIYSLAAPKL